MATEDLAFLELGNNDLSREARCGCCIGRRSKLLSDPVEFYMCEKHMAADNMRLACRNLLMLCMRMASPEKWSGRPELRDHALRIAKGVGIEPSILREGDHE